MAIDVSQLNNVKGSFQPLSYDEMARPIQNKTMGMLAMSNAYENAELESSSLGLSQEEYNTYLKPTMDRIRNASNSLTKYGLEGSGGINEFLRLRQDYTKNITPVKLAQQNRLANIKLQAEAKSKAPNPSSIRFKKDAREIPLEEYMKNPMALYTDMFNTEDIKKEVTVNLLALTKLTNSPTMSALYDPNGKQIKGQYMQNLTSGLSREELNNIIVNGDFSSPNGQLVKSIIDTTLSRFGITEDNGWSAEDSKAAIDAAYAAIPQAVGETKVNNIKDDAYFEQLRHSNTLAQMARQHQYNVQDNIASGKYPYIQDPNNPNKMILNPAFGIQADLSLTKAGKSSPSSSSNSKAAGTAYNKIHGNNISKAMSNKAYQKTNLGKLEQANVAIVGGRFTPQAESLFDDKGNLLPKSKALGNQKTMGEKNAVKQVYEILEKNKINNRQSLYNYLNNPKINNDAINIGLYTQAPNNSDANKKASNSSFNYYGTDKILYTFDSDKDGNITMSESGKFNPKDFNPDEPVQTYFDFKNQIAYLGKRNSKGNYVFYKLGDSQSLSQVGAYITESINESKKELASMLVNAKARVNADPTDANKRYYNFLRDNSRNILANITSNVVAERISNNYLSGIKDSGNTVSLEASSSN